MFKYIAVLHMCCVTLLSASSVDERIDRVGDVQIHRYFAPYQLSSNTQDAFALRLSVKNEYAVSQSGHAITFTPKTGMVDIIHIGMKQESIPSSSRQAKKIFRYIKSKDKNATRLQEQHMSIKLNGGDISKVQDIFTYNKGGQDMVCGSLVFKGNLSCAYVAYYTILNANETLDECIQRIKNWQLQHIHIVFQDMTGSSL